MNTSAGVWIDHRKAIIVTISDHGDETKEILSNVESQLGRQDGKHSTAPFESQLVLPDDKQQRGFSKNIKVFYDEVIAHVKSVHSVLIFGPGEAKGELQKLMHQNKLDNRDIVVESADKMWTGQIEAYVKSYFATIQNAHVKKVPVQV